MRTNCICSSSCFIDFSNFAKSNKLATALIISAIASVIIGALAVHSINYFKEIPGDWREGLIWGGALIIASVLFALRLNYLCHATLMTHTSTKKASRVMFVAATSTFDARKALLEGATKDLPPPSVQTVAVATPEPPIDKAVTMDVSPAPATPPPKDPPSPPLAQTVATPEPPIDNTATMGVSPAPATPPPANQSTDSSITSPNMGIGSGREVRIHAFLSPDFSFDEHSW